MRRGAQRIMDLAFAGAVICATGMILGRGTGAEAQPVSEAGRRIVAERCSTCHAIGPRGDSPRPAAIPLRELYERYPDEALTEAFQQGLIISHPAMPTFRFSDDELRAILAYLKSIQEMQGV